MSRPLRYDCADGWYHVTSRGIDRRAIFLEVRDRQHFLEMLIPLWHWDLVFLRTTSKAEKAILPSRAQHEPRTLPKPARIHCEVGWLLADRRVADASELRLGHDTRMVVNHWLNMNQMSL